MSLKKVGKWILLGVGVGAALGFADHLGQKRYQEKVSFDQKLRPLTASVAQKPNQSLSVRLTNIDDLPEDENEEMRLQVTIRANHQLDGSAQVRWSLPKGVTLVSGAAQDETIHLIKGEEFTREVSVRGISENQESMIKVAVTATVNGSRIGSDGYFASHPMQADLSRKAIPRKESRSFFSKASAKTEAVEKRRLPAGIQF